MESATENNSFDSWPKAKVRATVKMCGKSAHGCSVIVLWGKPHLEQDKICMFGFSFHLNLRVCRLDKWLLTI